HRGAGAPPRRGALALNAPRRRGGMDGKGAAAGRALRDRLGQRGSLMQESTGLGGTAGLPADAAQRARLMQAGQMLAGVVHEINNPLAVILGYAQLLHDRSTNEQDRQDLRTILDEARRAATLVDDMLGFTRRSTDAFETADLQRVVTSA